jgi:hypothetical protein
MDNPSSGLASYWQGQQSPRNYTVTRTTRLPLKGNPDGKFDRLHKHIAFYDGILTGKANGIMITETDHSVKIKSFF